MGTNFEDPALEHLMYWVRENRKTADKIYKLIQDIHRNGPDKGIGQPERLRHFPGWSRRIDHGNRLVYQMDGEDLRIIACKGHYED